MNQERIGNDIEEPWKYPEFHFGFGFAKYNPGDDPVILVKDVLSSLRQTEVYVMPELCPDGFPTQPNYGYNENKLKRIDNYLKEKVSSPVLKKPIRKENIVDVSKAADTVMDGLAEENHPVVQAFVALNNDFRGRISPQEIDFVTVEVLKQSHWTEIRGLLNMQLAVWKIDQYLK